MLSFALGTLRIDQSELIIENGFRGYRGFGKFGFIKNREISIIKELDRYGKVQQETVDRLSKVLDDNDFYVKMLVAADIWYRGNDMPKIFSPDMFTKENPSFFKISNISFGDSKIWDPDSLGTLFTYANYLKNNVYNQTDVTLAPENFSSFEQEGDDYGGGDDGDDGDDYGGDDYDGDDGDF